MGATHSRLSLYTVGISKQRVTEPVPEGIPDFVRQSVVELESENVTELEPENVTNFAPENVTKPETEYVTERVSGGRLCIVQQNDFTRSGIHKLPVETYHRICRFAGAGSTVLLGLTCKSLWEAMHPLAVEELNKETTLQERLTFLKLLEQDMPRHILCTLCKKLHIRQDPDDVALRSLRGLELIAYGPPCFKAAGKVILPDYKVQVTRGMVDLVLRAAELGTEYGLPSAFVDRTVRYQTCSVTTMQVEYTTEVKVIEPKKHLFLKVQFTTYFEMEEDLEEQLKSTKIQGCSHKEEESEMIMQSLTQVRDTTPPCAVTLTHQCRYCATDVAISIVRAPRQFIATLKVIAWKDLGPRAVSPERQPWSAQMNDSYRRPSRFDREQPGVYVFKTSSLAEIYELGHGEVS